MNTIFLFVLLVIIVCALIRSSKLKNNNLIMLIFAGIAITLFCGSINAIKYGTDISGYYNFAVKMLNTTNIRSAIDNSHFEAGYTVYCYCIVKLFGSAQAFLFVHSAIVTYLVFRFIYRNTKKCFLGIVAYLCIDAWMFIFTAFRQAVAIALCLQVYDFLKNKKWAAAVAFYALAITFHRSAIVFGIMFVFSFLEINVLSIGFTLLLLLFTYIYRSNIIGYFNNALDYDYGTNSSAIAALGGIISIAIYTLTFFMIYLSERNNIPIVKKYRLLIFMGIIGDGLYLFRFSALAMERIAFYFLPSYIVLLPESMSFSRDIKSNNLIRLLYVFLSLMLVYVKITHTMGTYITFWS